MGAALAISVPGFAWLRRRGRSFSGAALPEPPSARLDARLLAGSALFGIGWGIACYCPGPALANLAHGSGEAVLFVAALLAGSRLARWAGTQR